jgi:peptidyl-tRNA hydrolase, PTH1 family
VDAALIVGLGNPGGWYDRTRHNVGFMVADELSRRFRAPFVAGRGEYFRASVVSEGVTLHLVKPTTYMNKSGEAVAGALEHFGLTADATLLVLDDFQLPLGSLRLRPKGSDGGHNGLGSVIWTLGTDEIPRLRLGIGREQMPTGGEKKGFVLDPFDPEEFDAARSMVSRAADAALTFATFGIDRAMNVHNTQ